MIIVCRRTNSFETLQTISPSSFHLFRPKSVFWILFLRLLRMYRHQIIFLREPSMFLDNTFDPNYSLFQLLASTPVSLSEAAFFHFTAWPFVVARSFHNFFAVSSFLSFFTGSVYEASEGAAVCWLPFKFENFNDKREIKIITVCACASCMHLEASET